MVFAIICGVFCRFAKNDSGLHRDGITAIHQRTHGYGHIGIYRAFTIFIIPRKACGTACDDITLVKESIAFIDKSQHTLLLIAVIIINFRCVPSVIQ